MGGRMNQNMTTVNLKAPEINGRGFLELSMFTSTISSYIEQNDKYEQGDSAQQRQCRCHFVSQESLIGVLDDAGQHRLRLLPIWLQRGHQLLVELPWYYSSFFSLSLLSLLTASHTPTSNRMSTATKSAAKKIKRVKPVNLKTYSPPTAPAVSTNMRFFARELINCFLAFVSILYSTDRSISPRDMRVNLSVRRLTLMTDDPSTPLRACFAQGRLTTGD